jgi:hypothetical protein
VDTLLLDKKIGTRAPFAGAEGRITCAYVSGVVLIPDSRVVRLSFLDAEILPVSAFAF